MIALNLFSTSDNYSEAGTRRQALTVKLNLQVANAGILLQLADSLQNFGTTDEEFFPPGGYSLIRKCGGARAKSSKAATPAVISLTLLQESDT